MRFNPQMFSTAMKLLPLLCLCLLTRSGTTFALEQGSVISVNEGSDVMLPCSLSSKENIEYKRFEWKKGDQQVFVYDAGTDSKNGLPGQAQQFKDRVSHFQDELKNGNAAITITNTTVTDSGNYTCEFPNQQPRQTFNIQLVVVEPVTLTVKEDSDVILPCSLSNKENIEEKLFDWRKDGQKVLEVFQYNARTHYNNNSQGQDQQFKGRVSHFQDDLKYGNASIIIRKTKVNDSGNYTCEFPHLQPRQTFRIQLLVVGAAKKPSVTEPIQTKDGMMLECVVEAAVIKPTVEWQDNAGKKLTTEKPLVSQGGGYFFINLKTTVTKSANYRCVATQKEISHRIHTDIYVKVNGPPIGWIVGGVVGVLIVVLVVVLGIKFYRKRGSKIL